MAESRDHVEQLMRAEPQKEHQWLQKLVGDWQFEGEAPSEPGKAPEKFTGTESVRTLGGLWFVGEGHGDMPGSGEATTVLTLGYDPNRKRYVGTWIGSMMTHMWVYEGQVDAAGKVLTLNTEGPSMTEEGKMAKYRETIVFKNDNHRIFKSQARAEDGTWKEIMTANYKRKK
jgi:hypothetical protein